MKSMTLRSVAVGRAAVEKTTEHGRGKAALDLAVLSKGNCIRRSAVPQNRYRGPPSLKQLPKRKKP